MPASRNKSVEILAWPGFRSGPPAARTPCVAQVCGSENLDDSAVPHQKPPDHFPYCTIALIVLNVVIYAFTTDDLLVIRKDVLDNWALSHNNLSFVRLISMMFLHASPLHLIVNMLFLWLFGAPAEGRLRPWRFVPLYLLAGIVGSLLEDLISGAIAPDIPFIGASGAIMGLAGAYLYMFPFATMCVFWFIWVSIRPYFGVADWQAQWVILLFGGMDLLEGFWSGGFDGVAHFAHLGGLGAGFLLALLMRARRDSETRSAAQATRADVCSDYTILGYLQLHALMENPTEDVDLVMEYLRKAVRESLHPGNAVEPDECARALKRYGRLLLDGSDPVELARVALSVPNPQGIVPASFYLLAGSRVEGGGTHELALQLYRRVYDLDSQSLDAEMALYRMGKLADEKMPDKRSAIAAYRELLRLFPHGEMAPHARDALKRLMPPSSSNATTLVQPPRHP